MLPRVGVFDRKEKKDNTNETKHKLKFTSSVYFGLIKLTLCAGMFLFWGDGVGDVEILLIEKNSLRAPTRGKAIRGDSLVTLPVLDRDELLILDNPFIKASHNLYSTPQADRPLMAL